MEYKAICEAPGGSARRYQGGLQGPGLTVGLGNVLSVQKLRHFHPVPLVRGFAGGLGVGGILADLSHEETIGNSDPVVAYGGGVLVRNGRLPPKSVLGTPISMGLRTTAALAVLWGMAVACHEPVEVPPPTAKAPLSVRWRVRMFERLSPTGVTVRGALRLNPGTPGEWDGPMLGLKIQAGVLMTAEEPPRFLGEEVLLQPQDAHLELEPEPQRGRSVRRRVTGPVMLRVEDGVLRVVVELDAEDYVAGVVASELPDAPPQAQRAQAVLVRSYAWAHRARHGDHDLCDLTHCQVFKGVPESGPAVEAAASTAGKVLAHGNVPSKIFYSSTCGGDTVGPEVPWGTVVPGLVGVTDRTPSGDPWCKDSPHARWEAKLTHHQLRRSLREDFGTGWSDPATWVFEREPTGWVRSIGLGKPMVERRGEAIHIAWGRRFGWSTVKSANFKLTPERGAVVLKGRGLGHGVGLCQYGAMAMARAGHSGEEILKHYFPELSLMDLGVLPDVP